MLRLPRFLNSRYFQRVRRIAIVLLVIVVLLSLRNGFRQPDITNDSAQSDGRFFVVEKESEIIDRKVIEALPQLTAFRGDVHSEELVACVLVFCANRPQAIKNHLQQLIRLRGSPHRFPILVSQDGSMSTVADAIKTFVNESARVVLIQHEKSEPPMKMTRSDKNYFYIAQHYKWGLDYAFRTLNFSHVIITEDDLDIADDFFSYFASLKSLLTLDPTLWCISAWNDNGGKDLTDRQGGSRLWRTDFFPGLGWMLRAELWEELRGNWPEKYWDDWMRSPDVRKDRSCIRPELSRTAHNMKLAGKGTSGGLYKSYLSSITLPDHPLDFSLIDTSFLVKQKYDKLFGTWLMESERVEGPPSTIDTQHSYRLSYSNAREWRKIADSFKLMNDIRSGMARTAYMGVVTFWWKGARFFAVPTTLDIESLGKGEATFVYDKKWDLQSKFMDFQKQYCKPTRYNGPCDPKSPELKEWFRRRNMLKKLEAWGEMLVV